MTTKCEHAARERVLAKLEAGDVKTLAFTMPERRQLRYLERLGLIRWTGDVWTVNGRRAP